jgi:hypothetical protein
MMDVLRDGPLALKIGRRQLLRCQIRRQLFDLRGQHTNFLNQDVALGHWIPPDEIREDGTGKREQVFVYRLSSAIAAR